MNYIKGFGNNNTPADVFNEFQVHEDLHTGVNILFAVYECPPYEGYAFVLFEKDGKLYEVNASHCSCYGLEGQWEPEETTLAALKIRNLEGYYSQDIHNKFHEFIETLT